MSGKRLNPGDTFAGRYTIERALGRGGMGAVYLATQRDLGREVAIKILRPDRADDEVIVERFRNEARIIAQLGHPHVVGIHDFGETDDGVLYLVMERLKGHTLGTVLANEPAGRLPPSRALHIARDVARALSAAHARGVVHRDLKPDNIFLVQAESVRDFVKVLDFGIAKLVGEEEMNLTGGGLVAGTPGYIPPEHVVGKAPDDPRGDLYGLGVVLFEMLTGRRPFEGESAMKLFLRQLEEEAPRLEDAAPELELPAGVAALVARLLAKDVDQRPASAEAVIRDLDALGLEAPAHPTPEEVDRLDRSPDLAPDAPTVPDTPSVPATRPEAPELARTTTSTPRPLEAPRPARAGRTRAAMALIAVLAAAAAAWFVYRDGYAKAPEVETFPVAREDLTARFERSVAAYLDGDFRAARELVRRARESAPDEAAFLFLEGALLGRAGDTLAGTPKLLEAADRIERERPDWCQEAGAVAIAVREARAEPERAPELLAGCAPCRETPLGYILLARALETRDLGLRARALEVLDAGIARFPAAPLVHADKVNLLLGDLRVDEAAAALARGEALAPPAPALRRARAALHLARDELEAAASVLSELLQDGTDPQDVLQLAHVHLLRGESEDADRLLRSLLALQQPSARAQLNLEWAQRLVGAGRVEDGAQLLVATAQDALERGDPHVATYVVLIGLQTIDAAEAFDTVAALLDASTAALTAVDISEADHAYLAAIRLTALGATAADNGDLKTARKSLQNLEENAMPRLRASWRRGLPGYLRYRIALAEKDAEAAARYAQALPHTCYVRLAEAQAAELAGADDAEAKLRALVEPAAANACRAMSFGGAFVLRAYARLAEQRLAAGDPEGAEALVAEARARFPFADGTFAAHQRLNAVHDRAAR